MEPNLFDIDFPRPKKAKPRKRAVSAPKPKGNRFKRGDATYALHRLEILRDYSYRVCGSYRRQCETVGDLDILIVTDNFDDVVNRVADRYPILWSGPEKVSFMFGEIQVDFRRATTETVVTMQMYFTGSKRENIRLRSQAAYLGMKLNEYGLFHGDDRIPCDSEEEVYKTLGLPYVAPRFR